MKIQSILFTAITLLCFSIISTTANADNFSENGIKIFKQLDINNDGYITKDEVKKHYASNYHSSSDVNSDSSISLDEALANGKTVARFNEVDTNHDGKISVAEGLAIEIARFNAADTNHDGRISLEEYKSHVNTAE